MDYPLYITIWLKLSLKYYNSWYLDERWIYYEYDAPILQNLAMQMFSQTKLWFVVSVMDQKFLCFNSIIDINYRATYI